MTLDLEAIKAREAAAAPGPWYVDRGGEFDDPYYSISGVCRDRYGDNSLMVGSDKPTAEFIAHARTDVPELVAEVERLRQRLDECQLSDIEARNPGINMVEVRRVRSAPPGDRRGFRVDL